MKYTLRKKNKNPFLHSKNGFVIEVNNEFINFTGYSKNELIGKSLLDISYLLRISSQIYLQDIQNDYNCYIFTGSHEPKEVNIVCKVLESEDDKIYYFKENLNTHLENKFSLFNPLNFDNEMGIAIYSVPNLILLKANQKYLDFLDSPYKETEKIIGKKQNEIFIRLRGREMEHVWKNVLETGVPFHSHEFKYFDFNKGYIYLSLSLIPVIINNKIKYIIETTVDVTEKILNRQLIEDQAKLIEKQKDQLEAIIENMSDGILVTDFEGNFILMNDVFKNTYYGSDNVTNLGDYFKNTVYFNMDGNEVPFRNLPTYKVYQNKKAENMKVIIKRPTNDFIIDINASPIFDKKGNLYMVVICYHDISSIIEKEKIIKQQENQLEVIIGAIDEHINITNRNGHFIRLNKFSRDILGLKCENDPREMYKHFSIYDFNSKELLFEDTSLFLLNQGIEFNNKKEIIKKGDITKYISISGKPVFNEYGEIIMGVMLINDITDTIIKSKIVEDQMGKYETIIENMSEALLIFDKDGNFTKLNKAAREAYLPPFFQFNKGGNYQIESKYYDSNGNLISDENTPVHRVIRGETLVSYRMTIKNIFGIIYTEINGIPIYDNDGKFVSGILCCRNITEQQEYETILKNQYDWLNNMIDNLELPVIRFNYPDLNIIDINQKAFNLVKGLRLEVTTIGLVKEQICSDIITSFDIYTMYNNIQNMKEKNEASYFKYKKLIVSGEELFVNILYQPIFGVKGEIVEVIAIIIDITEEVKANQLLEENLKVQEEFFANISHELKTPLNLIFSTAQLFNLYLNNDSLYNNKIKVNNYIHTILQNCYRLSKLINNIVDLSKIESGFFELDLSNENIVNVVEEIVQSVSEYVESKGMSIIFDTDVEEKIIACDPNKIERVILNLISNAIKFSNPGDEITVTIHDNSDRVEISINDTGIGIDKNHLDIIFERYKQVDKSFTRNAEGSGIGLCLVKSIVELHEGKINVESKLNQGTKFIIDLPSKIVEEKIENNVDNKMQYSKVEMINVEFSDIYP